MNDAPGIFFAGPMLGRHPGWVVNPCEILAPRLEGRGYACCLASHYLNRYRRAADILATLFRRRRTLQVLCLQVYGGPSFVVEDLTSWWALRLGYRLVMVLRGGSLPEFMQRFPGWSRRVLRRAHLWVAPSAYLAEALRPLGLAARVIPNAIDLSYYPYRHRPAVAPRLLWMRTFHDLYNPLLAVETLARLKPFYPQAKLSMAGQEKGLLNEVKLQVERLGLQEEVRFAGFLDLSGKQQQFAGHDIYLSTNRIDNTPVSVLEAAAFGLPVVATRVGGVPFLLQDGQTALLVEDDAAEAMAQAVRRLVEEPGLAGRLSENGRRLAEQFDWSQVLDLWEDAFSAAMGRAS